MNKALKIHPNTLVIIPSDLKTPTNSIPQSIPFLKAPTNKLEGKNILTLVDNSC